MAKETKDAESSVLLPNLKARLEVPLREGELFILAGVHDRNLKLLRASLPAKLIANQEEIVLLGTQEEIHDAQNVIEELLALLRKRGSLDFEDVETMLRLSFGTEATDVAEGQALKAFIQTPEKRIFLRTPNQEAYYQACKTHDLVFAIGPAGTGKTYLAVAMAVQALTSREVRRIVLVRPAVEAGENLGFLPGDLKEKVDPYFRPLYDALMEMLQPERVKRLIERNVIEIAPLAYMRGRTLSDSFVILDEAQNTTSDQMMMFLTRLGSRSKAVITGDRTQIDLPKRNDSGLLQVPKILGRISGIAFVELVEADAVRHELVRQIIRAYQEFRDNDPGVASAP